MKSISNGLDEYSRNICDFYQKKKERFIGKILRVSRPTFKTWHYIHAWLVTSVI